MAQCYMKKNCVDIGVMDNGISIPQSFENAKIKFKVDEEAISLALAGVSSKTEFSRGWGLPSTKEYVLEKLKGELYIFSRRGGVTLKYPKERKVFKLEKYFLPGTLVYARFNIPSKAINIF